MVWATHVWVLTGLHILVFLLGVPGNALIIRVFAKKQRKSSTHIFILGLAIADLYVCLATAALVAYWFLEYSIDSPWVCQGGYFSIVLGVYYSLFVTTVIAVERYYAVCKPLEKVVTPFRARIAMFVSVLAAALVSAPSVTFSDIITGTRDNHTVYMCWPAPDDLIEWASASGMYSIYVVSLIMVAILYGKVYYTIRNKVLGPTLSTKPTASMKSKSIDSRSDGGDTDAPFSDIEEAECNNIEVPSGNLDNGVPSVTHSPAKSNGSITISNGNYAAPVKETDNPEPDINPSKTGSIEVLIPDIDSTLEKSKNEHAYANDVDDGVAEETAKIIAAPDVDKDEAVSQVDSKQDHTVKETETSGQDVDGVLLHPVTNGVSNNNSLSVSPTNTAASSPVSTPKKGAVVVNPTTMAMAMVPMVKTLVPIKYDDDYNNEANNETNSGGKKSQPSLMSFRGFLRRPMSLSKRSFNSQASTRSLASQRMQNKTTNMLLLVTIVTYVTWIPTLISSVVLVDTPDIRDEKYSEVMVSILLLMKFLFVLNHAANPFIYTIVNDRFRQDCVKEIRQLFGCSDKRRF